MNNVNYLDIINEISVEGCPLGQSLTQDVEFSVNIHFTEARKKKAAKNQLFALTKTYIDTKYRYEELKIEVDEINHKIKNSSIDTFEERRLKLRLEQIKVYLLVEKKSVSELLLRIENMYNLYKSFKDFTHLEFESQEKDYFKSRLGLLLERKQVGTGHAELARLGVTEEEAKNYGKLLVENDRWLEKNKELDEGILKLLGGE